MWGWLKRVFGGAAQNSTATVDGGEEIDEHSRLWDERMTALQERLGPSEDMVFHSVIPLYLGGFADVVEFRSYVDGHCYVTSDLTGDESQLRSILGNYELMICTREKSDWAPNLISRLAKYTLEAVLQPGETMDIGSALPDEAKASALLFEEPELPSNQFRVGSSIRSGILLCITILPDELELKMSQGSDTLLKGLKSKGVFPFSDLDRNSVV